VSIVIDASVVVAALLDSGKHGAWAEGVLAGDSLHAPELLRAEATNVLQRLERARLISSAEANAAHDDLMQLDVELFTFDSFAERIWELRHTITSYEAWYVALAEALKLPLATLDQKLAKASGIACDIVTLASD
jgi:predicted nucleic acid-binding protein